MRRGGLLETKRRSLKGNERGTMNELIVFASLILCLLFLLYMKKVPAQFVLTLPRLHELFSAKTVQAKNPEMLSVLLESLRAMLYSPLEEVGFSFLSLSLILFFFSFFF